MGMRIRRKWDLLSDQRAALAILSTAFLLGGLCGIFLAILSSETDTAELSEYLEGYLKLAQSEELPRNLWPLLWGQAKYFLAALIFGWTVLGIVGFPVLLCVRGFFFSFSVTCFCQVFGNRGLFPGFILFGLPALLWVPALFAVGVPGFLSAQQLLRRSVGEGRGVPVGNGVYWFRAGVCGALTLAAGMLEYWIVPVLLRVAARVIL